MVPISKGCARVDEFLAQQLPWVRKALRLEIDEEVRTALLEPGGLKIRLESWNKYLELLRDCPERLREVRKLESRLASKVMLSSLPAVPPGAPAKEWREKEISELDQRGLNHRQIAEELNRRYPDLRDRKGNLRPTTKEVVAKVLAHLRKLESPEKT